jgi:hypothetical protein
MGDTVIHTPLSTLCMEITNGIYCAASD